MAPTPAFLPGESQGRGSLVGCSPWGREESDTTKRLLFHFSLSCLGEGNGNPLQCSCLENPRDGGAWWAAVYGVAQSWTRLKRLSSSSSSSRPNGQLTENKGTESMQFDMKQNEKEQKDMKEDRNNWLSYTYICACLSTFLPIPI